MANTEFPQPPAWVRERLCAGLVIPAHPLALTDERRWDERRQRALTRYYMAAGAGGIAVGVHTTQFAIRDPKHGLFRPVLELTADEIKRAILTGPQITALLSDFSKGIIKDQRLVADGARTVKIAGVCGATKQAVGEAALARSLGYHAGLLSLAALRDANDDALIKHCFIIAREIPLIGFYLQPAAGGRLLSQKFWRQFVEIPNVIAIKIAPFNRYQTLDVLRAVAESGREDIALYTGNDDSIVSDLLTEFDFATARGNVRLRIVGGLIGHWACWTRKAFTHLAQCHATRHIGSIRLSALTRGAQITDCNAAFFDAANGFAGCIPGIHEVLRRQGLLTNTLTLDPNEVLSPGQSEEIDRVYRAYPHLNDDEFVRAHLDEWLRD
ncbi:MAG: dihydrodipicolinate synthase family protein [Verrucomicrobia bacterium]|nr:dihydrodipicolinate synthase family protein [Verrucomicrobiota bacterium]